ncbi:MAG: response regulator transcription factor [Verrucomicrobiota bacterium]
MEASPILGMRVLIADDQKSVGTALADLVGCCNHEVVDVVGSGLEAIQAYTRLQPDVVLMDYSMPKLNGATACRTILARDPAARVIFISGWSPSDDVATAGALTILAKPVRLETLQAALNSAASTLGLEDLPALFEIAPTPNLEDPPALIEVAPPLNFADSPAFFEVAPPANFEDLPALSPIALSSDLEASPALFAVSSPAGLDDLPALYPIMQTFSNDVSTGLSTC